MRNCCHGDVGPFFEWPKRGAAFEIVSLDDLLPRAAVTKIDFLSMDIELSEPKALAAFDLRRYAPRLVCIEAHPETRRHILDYFTARGYTVVGKYLRLDTINLWFTPLSAP